MSIARMNPRMGIVLLVALFASCSKSGINGTSASKKSDSRAEPTSPNRRADGAVKVGLVSPDPASVQRANASAQRYEPDDLNAKIARQSTAHSAAPIAPPIAPPASSVSTESLKCEVLSSSDSRVDPVAPAVPVAPVAQPVATVANPTTTPIVREPVKVETPDPPAPRTEPVAQQAPVNAPAPVVEAKVEPTVPPSAPTAETASAAIAVREVEPAPSPPPAPPAREEPAVTAAPVEKPAIAPVTEAAPKPKIVRETNPAPVAIPVSVATAAAPAPESAPTPVVRPPAANVTPATPAAATNAPHEKTLTSMIHDLETNVGRQPNDLEQQLRLRMLYAVLGDEDKALAATPGMSGDSAEMVRGLVRPMIEVCKESNRDPAACASRQLAAVEELRQFLRTRADLTIPRLLLCRSVEGFDRFDAIDPPRVPARAPVTCQLYVEIDNFTSQRTPANEYRTSISMRTSLLSKSGRELWSTVDEKIEDIARQPRRDFFVAKEMSFPDTLPAGDYIIKVDIEDKLGGKASTKSLGLKVTAGAVKSAAADASQP